MATRLYIDGNIFQGSKDIDELNPYQINQVQSDPCNGGGTWFEFAGRYIRDFVFVDRKKLAGGRFRITYTQTGVCFFNNDDEWQLYCGSSPQFGSQTFKKGATFTNPPPVASSTPCSTGGGECELTVNYSDGSTFNYGAVPCNAEVYLLDDCCDYSAMATKANQAINLLLNIKNG